MDPGIADCGVRVPCATEPYKTPLKLRARGDCAMEEDGNSDHVHHLKQITVERLWATSDGGVKLQCRAAQPPWQSFTRA